MSIDTDAIRARLDAATRGSWVAEAITQIDADGTWSLSSVRTADVDEDGDYQAIALNVLPGNGDLIAHAPEDIAGLLNEVTYHSNTSKAREKALVRAQSRAEKAEAQVARVRALADECFEAAALNKAPEMYYVHPQALRAALDGES